MRSHRIVAGGIGLWAWLLGVSLQAGPIIEETFSGYPENALLSASPAGPALGLSGDWRVFPDDDFFVNSTTYANGAGVGKAIYDRPPGDNGTRTATRSTSTDHVLFEHDGDVFYASFLIDPALAGGDMTCELGLTTLGGGGAVDLSFGIVNGQYIVGNGGVDVDLGGGAVNANEQLVVVRIEYGDASSGPDDNEVVTLWVNPVDESSMPVMDHLSADILARGGGRITDVSIRGSQMGGNPAFFDNLRVGSSFRDVRNPLPGDANRDGKVDDLDASTLAANWQKASGATWDEADFSGDGEVTDLDASILAANWQAGVGTVVPEPAGWALLAGVAMLVLLRGRRKPLRQVG